MNHPNICTIYDVDEHAGRRFIAMELLEGQTLKQRMLGRRLNVHEMLAVALGVVDGLEAAHAEGVVHRRGAADGGDLDAAATIDVCTRVRARLGACRPGKPERDRQVDRQGRRRA